jgi:GT2 family glycosyltransferase
MVGTAQADQAARSEWRSLASPPLISVVIPSYNHRAFICQAIDSALEQSHRNLEVIVIDDGSRDGSPALLSQRYGDDPRVRLMARENRGAHATLNEAVELARGDFISILNSDDLYLPGRFERLVQAARDGGGHPFFGITGLRVVDERGEPSPSSGPTRYYGSVLAKYEGRPSAAAFWVGNLAMTTSNFFFSREVFERVGGFAPLRYTHDWDWALRASEVVTPTRLDDALLCYRVHGSNTIAEGNMWKHVSENAYVFARAIQRTGIAGLAERAGVGPSEVMQALLQNESFCPLPTLTLLGLGIADDELTRLLETGGLEKLLQAVPANAREDVDLMLSAEHLRQKLGARSGKVGTQASPGKTKPALSRTLDAVRKAGKRAQKKLRKVARESQR